MSTGRNQGLPGEFELIARYFAPLAKGYPGAFGLLDDAAVIRPADGRDLVVKTDAIVSGVHFRPEDPPDLVGRKALRVNLSDLTAKGAVPLAYMLDLMLPRDVEEAWVAAFARGLAADQAEFGIHLIGGDTDSTPGPISIAIMAFGEVDIGRMIRRDGARAGDTVYVTGTIGDAALGLAVLCGRDSRPDPTSAEFLIGRYRLPAPPVSLGPHLVGLATASIDVSDGLIADLRHVCEASGVAADIWSDHVPLSEAARSILARDPDALQSVLSGGDDYQILFTAGPAAADTLAVLAREFRLSITAIGQVTARSDQASHCVSVFDPKGRPLPLDREGWAHF